MIDEVDFMVGRQLRRRRRLMGLTQQELGAACGISFQQVQKYECANNRMSVAMLWRFACALEVEVSYFFAGAPRRHVEFRSESPPADATRAARAA
jgi:transcriptional regulator with XRE-family HTH domain